MISPAVTSSPSSCRRIRARASASHATGAVLDGWVRPMKPFSFSDYVALQMGARAVLSDSGTITEEASILGCARSTCARRTNAPRGWKKAAVMLTGLNRDRVLQCLDILDTGHGSGTGASRSVRDYEPGNVSEKVVRLIHSYTDMVNRVVWRR